MGQASQSPLVRIKTRIKQAMPDWFVAVYDHHKKHGSIPHFIRPRTFNEKVLHRIIFDRRAILTQMADKAAVRSYVESRLGPEILTKLYHLTDRPETIPFDDLPDAFVVKPTHGQGWIRIVRDKSVLDRDELIATCRDWLNLSYYKFTREWVYKNIKPRILVEELLDDGAEFAPADYKFFVFDGVVEFVQVVSGRNTDNVKRRLYSLAWKKLDVSMDFDDIGGEEPRPRHFDEMIAAAKALGQGMDFIRVDLYDTPAGIKFGELTTTPGCSMYRYQPKEFDYYLGSRWKLPSGRSKY